MEDRKTEEEIMKECLGDEFFVFDDEPTTEEIVEESTEGIIDIDAKSVEVKEEPILLDAPEAEVNAGIDFAKRLKGNKVDEKDTENVENPEKIDEIPQGDETHQADIKMTTTIVDSKSGETSEEEAILATINFPEIPSKVFFKKGLTRNLGNFESYRIDVGVEMPCKTEDVKKYVLSGGKVVEKRLVKEIKKAQRLYGNAGGSVFDRVNLDVNL